MWCYLLLMRGFSRFVLFCFTVALFKNEKDIADYYIKKIQEELLQRTDSGGKNLRYFLLILFHWPTSILALLSPVPIEVLFWPFQLLGS